jgi:hypothetical protein
LCWLLVPVSLAWLATETDAARVFFPRYLIVSAPAAFVLTAMCVRLAPGQWAQVALGIVLALAALGTSRSVEQFALDGRLLADRSDDWRSAITFFNKQSERGRYPVLVRSWLIEADGLRQPHDPYLVAYCLYPVTGLYPIDAHTDRLVPLPRTDSGRMEPALLDRLRSSGGVWLILGGSPEVTARIERDLMRILPTQDSSQESQRSQVGGQQGDWHIAVRRTFGNVQVLLIQRAEVLTPSP